MAETPTLAEILRIVGRGPKLSRSLTRAEAAVAMTHIIDGRAADVQIGALLLLMRYRRETAEELAGMADAVAAHLPPAMNGLAVDLDWPSYADRHRQQPWFVLAALLLAGAGVRVLMHGLAGADGGYAPTRPVLRLLDIPQVETADGLAAAFARSNLVYIGIEQFAPALDRLFALRPLLGVRTAVNTLARTLNPAAAPAQMQGVFHPNYRGLHAEVARLRQQPVAAIFKGGGGEVQCNPDKPCRIAWVRDGEVTEDDWPALRQDDVFDWRAEDLEPSRIAALWHGEIAHPAAQAAIVGTAAIALHALGRAGDAAEAQRRADELWQQRLSRARAAAAS